MPMGHTAGSEPLRTRECVDKCSGYSHSIIWSSHASATATDTRHTFSQIAHLALVLLTACAERCPQLRVTALASHSC